LICKQDEHSISRDYSYDIRSLYFDDPFGTAYQDKLNGESIRKKYRIRMYNNNFSYIKLEAKHKVYNMTYKEEQEIPLDVCERIINKESRNIPINGTDLLSKFLIETKLYGLQPAVIVDYRRLAYVHPASDVRITFDENIRSGMYSFDMFNRKLDTQSVCMNDLVEIEIKYNEYIPEHIQLILNSVPKSRIALSKYALCYSMK